MAFQEKLQELKTADDIDELLIYKGDEQIAIIPNDEGTKGSLVVYSNLIDFEDGEIDKSLALKGLNIFDELVEEARKKPGTHPNIDLLLDVVETEIPLNILVIKDISRI